MIDLNEFEKNKFNTSILILTENQNLKDKKVRIQ